MDIEEVRRDFPITKSKAYMNNASYAPMPLPAIKAMADFAMEYSEKGPDSQDFNVELKARVAEVRSQVARLINCEPEEAIFTASATEGINMVANGLALGRGDKIIIRDGLHEHPSNFLPWLRLARSKGVELVPLRVDEDGFFELAELEDRIDERTKLIALSHVLYNTGAILPVAEVGKVASQHGIPFFVDAAQSVGCMEVDVERVGCDFMVFTAAKWLCGPLGVGLLYCKREAAKLLEPLVFGPGSVRELSESGYVYHETPHRLQDGFRNWPGVFGLSAAIDYLTRMGLGNIRRRDMELAGMLRDGLARDPKFELYGPDEQELRNSIVPFNVKGMTVAKVVEHLEREGTIFAERELGLKKVVRASPHFFNNFEEVEMALSYLKRLA